MACCIIGAFFLSKVVPIWSFFNYTGSSQNLLTHERDDETVNLAKPNCGVTWLEVQGMTCASCAIAIENVLKQIQGVSRVAVSVPFHTVAVYHGYEVTSEDIIHVIDDLGYQSRHRRHAISQKIRSAEGAEELDLTWNTLKKVLVTIASLELLYISASLTATTNTRRQWAIQALMVIISTRYQFHSASQVHARAGNAIRLKRISTDVHLSFLFILGNITSALNLIVDGPGATSYFRACARLHAVILLSRFVELLMRRHSVSGYVSLLRLQSHSTLAKLKDREDPFPALFLQPGDEIVIEPYTLIPCDCYVSSGESEVDQSTVTGESLPITKVTGSLLMSGTRNISGRLTAVIEKQQSGSTLSMIIQSMVEGTTQRSQIQDRIQYTTGVFVTLILLLTAITSLLTWIGSEGMSSNLQRINMTAHRAMTVLAAACPCALNLAIPAANFSCLDVARSNGIFIRGGVRSIEELARITHVVFDKTGTLTNGILEVTSCEWVADAALDKNKVYLLLSIAEGREATMHPVANALFNWALKQLPPDLRNIHQSGSVAVHQRLPGQGLFCEVDTAVYGIQQISVGNAKYFESQDIQISHENPSAVGISVWVAVNGSYVGKVVLSDTIRPEAPQVINHLAISGLHVTMATGDAEKEAHRVAKLLSISAIAADALPQDKLQIVRDLQATRCKVAMIGDGSNDGSALAAADVGISFCQSLHPLQGVADVSIAHPDLSKLPMVIEMAKMTLRQVRLSISWAIAYNLFALLLAVDALGFLGLKDDVCTSGTIMAMSSVLVSCFSLHLHIRLRSCVNQYV